MTSEQLGNDHRIYLTFSVVTLWALASGFFFAFSIFAPYDDEGYLMITVKQFVDGGVLYDQIYTQYGPAYYFYKFLLSGILGLPITHDVTRLVTLVVSTTTAGVIGVVVYRLTRSHLFTAAAFVATSLILSRTAAEPGHPQCISGLGVAVILLLFTYTSSAKWRSTILFAAAAIIACILLIKINLGVFLGLATALVFTAHIDLGRLRRPILIGLAFIAIAVPFALTYKHFDAGWLTLCIIFAVGVVTAAITVRPQVDEQFSMRWATPLLLGFGVTAGLIVMAQIATGTSLNALVDTLIMQPRRFGDDFVQTAPMRAISVPWAMISLVGAVVYRFFRRRVPDLIWAGSKIAFGSAVLISTSIGLSTYLGTFLLLNFATPFLWLLFIGRSKATPERSMLVFAATLLTLQIFPITGTQMSYGTFLMTAVGAVCAHDGVQSVRALRKDPVFWRFAGGVCCLVLTAAACSWGVGNYLRYRHQPGLGLPGARLIHLPEKDVQQFRGLVYAINESCDNFVSMPGFSSLYFWTQKEPPTKLNATAWMSLLDASQQRAVVDKIDKIPRLCAVYEPQWTLNGARNRDLSSQPLAAYILNGFTAKAQFGEYQLMVRR